MTSFATAGAGAKACTSILPGKRGYHDTFGATLLNVTGGLRYTTLQDAASDAINITGSGVWTFGYFAGTSGDVNAYCNVIVTIDGVTVLSDLTSNNNQNYGLIQVGSIFRSDSSGNSWSVTQGAIPFNTSLVVNVASTWAGYYYYDYYKT